MAVVGRRGRARPRTAMACVLSQVLPGTHLPVREGAVGADHAAGPPSRAGGPVDVAGPRRVRATTARPAGRGGPQIALGTPLPEGSFDAVERLTGVFATAGEFGHPGRAAKTLRPFSRPSKRASLGSGQRYPAQERAPDRVIHHSSVVRFDRCAYRCLKQKLRVSTVFGFTRKAVQAGR